MDISPIGLILFIVVVSGVIAYFADHVGRTIGKKKLRYRGLRPKHVASIGTVMLGVLISSISIGLAMLLSQSLRTVLIEGKDLIRQRDQVKHDLERKNKELNSKSTDLTRVEDQSRQLQSQIRVKAADLDRTIKELTARKAEVTRLTSSLGSLRKQVVGLNSQLKSINVALTSTSVTLKSKTAELSRTNKALVSVRAELKAAQDLQDRAVKRSNEVETENLRLTHMNADLEQDQQRLTRDIANLRSEQERLNREREAARADLLAANTSLAEKTKDLADADQRLHQAETLIADYESLRKFYESTTDSSRKLPLTFGVREEIVRIPVAAGLSYDAASSAVTSVLRSARIIAEERGAKPNGTMHTQAADIMERVDPRTGKVVTTAADIIRETVRTLASSKDPLVIIAFSTVNAFQGEPVSLDLVILPNPLIYHDGVQITEGLIDGRKTDGEIFQAVSAFITTKVKPKAIKDHMIPRSAPDANLGEVSQATILELIHRIKEQDRVIRLQAVVNGDTRAADSLKLTFRVR